MLNSLPGEPITDSTVKSLENSSSVKESFVIYGVGMDGQEIVTQFVIGTGSRLHLLSLAAPDDAERDGWFKLGSYDTPEGNYHAVMDATDAAKEYRQEFDLDISSW